MIKTAVIGALEAKKKIDILRLPPAKRRRLLLKLMQQTRKQSRERIKQQRDLNGKPFAPRKDNKNKRKMLRQLGKKLIIRTTPDKGTLKINNPVGGRIAKEQQDGITEVMTSQKMKRIHGKPDYDGPATRRQAKALREVGYKVKRKSGKGWKTPSLKWMTENLTLGQAGLITRLMRDEKSKTQWEIKLPSRAFLGATDEEVKTMINTIYDETIKQRA
ncbi:MAG: phage virion morphogenesis protein [Cellvibrionaceae bacterium]